MTIYDKSNEQIYTKAPSLSGDCVKTKRVELKRYFKATWQRYESLFSLINNDGAYYERPEPLRHPLIFYFGHTASFYINKLILGKYITQRMNPHIEAICAVGVDEMSWDDLNSAHYDWPSVDNIRSYRQQVFALVNALIDTMPISLPIKQDSLAWIILMGCEHERIHLETSSVIMRMLPLADLTNNGEWQTCDQTASAPLNELIPVAGKKINFGKPATDDSYGWDNEFGQAELALEDFHAAKFLVSNAEFMTFIDSGGYQQTELWDDEGQAWLTFSKATMPRFWLKKTTGYWQRNLLNEIPLPLDWPVEVNCLEAKAFCHWKNSLSKQEGSLRYRLPTEGEWLCLRDQVKGDLPTWEHAPGNINSEYYASSCPVNQFSQGQFYDIVGNVWQWTDSAIDGFNGFSVHPLYDDFSTPTFDSKHNLIKGGSWISTGNEAMRYSRYAFRRHFFQHAGFRYIASMSQTIPNLNDNHYETDKEVCQQLHSDFKQLRQLDDSLLTSEKQNELVLINHELGSDYLQKIANSVTKVINSVEQDRPAKLLDLGCNTGGLSFLLSQYFNHIDAIDFSARYIQHGVKLAAGNAVRYVLPREGELVDFYEFNLPKAFHAKVKNIHFSQGDMNNLKEIFSGYDVIIVQNILEQSYDPALFLENVHQRLNQGGQLIIISTYQFDQQVTDRSKWLGGQKINGENVTGFDALTEIMSKRFTLTSQVDLTRLLQTSQRHSHVTQPQLSIWQLRSTAQG